MEQALIDFYYQFHKHQHYFLCHDILEESWKTNASFSKRDAVVSLILFATGCYHYRRQNIKGAKKSLSKARQVIMEATDKDTLHLDIPAYNQLINQLLGDIEVQRAFQPVHLPIDPYIELKIKAQYQDYLFQPHLITDSFIVNHHIERDRSEVIRAKAEAQQQRLALRKDNNHFKK